MKAARDQMPVLDDHARLPWRFHGETVALAVNG